MLPPCEVRGGILLMNDVVEFPVGNVLGAGLSAFDVIVDDEHYAAARRLRSPLQHGPARYAVDPTVEARLSASGLLACIRRNYRDHVHEVGARTSEMPTFFAKFACAINVSGRPDTVPANISDVDWDGELALVAEKICRSIDSDHAIEPGDDVSTGTPAGIDWALTSRQSLGLGGALEIEIETLCSLARAEVAALAGSSAFDIGDAVR